MSDHGLVHLRYRPSPDVATAQIELPGVAVLGTRRTTEDSDVSLDWTSTSEGELLTGFSLLHCSSRLDSLTGPDSPLPPSVARAVAELVRSATSPTAIFPSTADGEVRAAVSARFERTVALPLHELLGSGAELPPAGTADAAAELGAAVQRFVRAFRATSTSHSDRSAALVRALQELAAAIEEGGGSRASGALHNARRAVRGGIALTNQERRQLADLLREAGDPSEWSAVAARLSALAERLAP